VQLQYAIRRKCVFDITNLAQYHMKTILLISKHKIIKQTSYNKKIENINTQISKKRNTYKQTNKRKKERRFLKIQKVGESCH
jgi:hypothetical protein